MNDVIVVGTDGSATAKVAVERAAALAKLTGARIELVGGYREESALAMSSGMATGEVGEEMRKGTDVFLAEAADELRSAGLEVETHCMKGDADDALIEVAETTSADLIVVGSRGMHGGLRFLFGRVPNRVSHHAPCSVM